MGGALYHGISLYWGKQHNTGVCGIQQTLSWVWYNTVQPKPSLRMNTPTLQDHLTAALHNWAIGKRQDLKDLISANPNILSTYKGTGQIESYFVPVLYIRELCQDLMSVGFPIENLFDRNRGDFMWVDWPEAVAHVAKYKPSLLRSLVSDGPFTEDTIDDVEPLGCFSPDDDENTAILYDYWPRLIQESVRDLSEDFVNSSTDAQWLERHERLQKTVTSLTS